MELLNTCVFFRGKLYHCSLLFLPTKSIKTWGTTVSSDVWRILYNYKSVRDGFCVNTFCQLDENFGLHLCVLSTFFEVFQARKII